MVVIITPLIVNENFLKLKSFIWQNTILNALTQWRKSMQTFQPFLWSIKNWCLQFNLRFYCVTIHSSKHLVWSPASSWLRFYWMAVVKLLFANWYIHIFCLCVGCADTTVICSFRLYSLTGPFLNFVSSAMV